MALRSLAVSAATGAEVAPVAERRQISKVAVRDDHDVAAPPAVPAVGTRRVGT